MIGALDPHVVSAEIVVTRPVPQRLRFIAVCSAAGCGTLAGTTHARVCTRTDCGLSDRFHHSRDNAA